MGQGTAVGTPPGLPSLGNGSPPAAPTTPHQHRRPGSTEGSCAGAGDTGAASPHVTMLRWEPELHE